MSKKGNPVVTLESPFRSGDNFTRSKRSTLVTCVPIDYLRMRFPRMVYNAADGRMRKHLSAAFSTKALLEQEDIVQGCIDKFMHRLGSEGDQETGLNMIKEFEMLAFDILGEMAFGESFGNMEAGKPHPWIELITEHIFYITVLDNLRRFTWLEKLGRIVLSKLIGSVRQKHSQYSRDKVFRRLKNKTTRRDFMRHLIDRANDQSISREEMTTHASALIIAGGETLATYLAGVLVHLLQNSLLFAKLQQEVRSRYSNVDKIKAIPAQQLPYPLAVIQEGLGIWAPGSQGFPRLSPGAFVGGDYIPAGTECYTSAWAITHDECYFHASFEFKPERWLDADCTDVKEASQPFSRGPWGCLDKNFAYMEMCLIIAEMKFLSDCELLNNNLE
ncbi:hypothetical protein D6D01_02446 [Aureobasidium pullulans]|uniref:Cytochrome P450 n=1 Tax=Aureobasidium pullulans TaxID=5580 RepID=A0A4V4JXG1_AURPU|nr:hypothetical protein D6D01_02446 [Aureobasidium pullulans]